MSFRSGHAAARHGAINQASTNQATASGATANEGAADHDVVTDYYRAVAPILLAHLRGHRIHTLGPARTAGHPGAWEPTPDDGAEPDPHLRPRDSADPDVTIGAPVTFAAPATISPPGTTDALLALVARGVTGFAAVAAGRMSVRLAPGDGSDTATAATATLHLAEQCAADGLVPVPLTDGSGGLWLTARVDGDPAAAAARYTDLLTTAAPELATPDRDGADGRTLVTPAARDRPIPIPYTLVPSLGWPAAVIPLHLDEVAAITAGMPAEIWATQVADRIAARGDLAAALLPAADRVG